MLSSLFGHPSGERHPPPTARHISYATKLDELASNDSFDDRHLVFLANCL